jgi:muconolactone D-isomerase
MLVMAEIDVRIPVDFDAREADRLKAEEKARYQEIARTGKWRHIWRKVGQYANISILDVEDNDELQALLTSLPLYPFMDIKLTPIVRHPSSIHDDDR